MSKPLSLWFALSSIILMSATAVMISHNGWIAILLALLTLFNVGYGFVIKARLRRRAEGQPQLK